jgi:hypothetical protein
VSICVLLCNRNESNLLALLPQIDKLYGSHCYFYNPYCNSVLTAPSITAVMSRRQPSRTRKPLHPDLIALDQAHIRTMRQLATEMNAVHQSAELTGEESLAQLALLEQRFDEHWQQFSVDWKQLEERLEATEEASAKVNSAAEAGEEALWYRVNVE